MIPTEILSLLQVRIAEKYEFDFSWIYKKWSKEVKYFADKVTYKEVTISNVAPDANIVIASKYVPTNFTWETGPTGVKYIVIWKFAFAFKNHEEKIPFGLDKDRVAKLISTPIGGSKEALQKIESLVTQAT